MTVANTTALELLGKTVSFKYSYYVQLTEQSRATFTSEVSGVVVNIISEPEILIDDGYFYKLSDLVDFIIC